MQSNKPEGSKRPWYAIQSDLSLLAAIAWRLTAVLRSQIFPTVFTAVYNFPEFDLEHGNLAGATAFRERTDDSRMR